MLTLDMVSTFLSKVFIDYQIRLGDPNVTCLLRKLFARQSIDLCPHGHAGQIVGTSFDQRERRVTEGDKIT